MSGRCWWRARAKRQIRLTFKSTLRHQVLSWPPLLCATQELSLTVSILHRRKLREVKFLLKDTQPVSGKPELESKGSRGVDGYRKGFCSWLVREVTCFSSVTMWVWGLGSEAGSGGPPRSASAFRTLTRAALPSSHPRLLEGASSDSGPFPSIFKVILE